MRERNLTLTHFEELREQVIDACKCKLKTEPTMKRITKYGGLPNRGLHLFDES